MTSNDVRSTLWNVTVDDRSVLLYDSQGKKEKNKKKDVDENRKIIQDVTGRFVVLSITNGTISARWSLLVGRHRHLLTKTTKKKSKKLKRTHSPSNTFEESILIPNKNTTIETPPSPL